MSTTFCRNSRVSGCAVSIWGKISERHHHEKTINIFHIFFYGVGIRREFIDLRPHNPLEKKRSSFVFNGRRLSGERRFNLEDYGDDEWAEVNLESNLPRKAFLSLDGTLLRCCLHFLIKMLFKEFSIETRVIKVNLIVKKFFSPFEILLHQDNPLHQWMIANFVRFSIISLLQSTALGPHKQPQQGLKLSHSMN